MRAQELSEQDFMTLQGALFERAQQGKLCPRQAQAGPRDIFLSSYSRHGEHLGIIGKDGCALLVFAGCALRCRGCLYYRWAFDLEGLQKTPDQIAKILLRAQEQGNKRVVLMNASHIADLLIPAIQKAIADGFSLPLVWYTHGYEYPETLALLARVFDIFAVDFKFADPGYAEYYLGAYDYVQRLFEATLWLDRNLGPLVVEDGEPKGGYVLRHLYLPGQVKETELALKWIAQNLGTDTYVEIVSSFVPAYMSDQVGLTRRTTVQDIDTLRALVRKLKMTSVQFV